MNGNALLAIFTAFSLLAPWPSRAQTNAAADDRLEFLDGSFLHGDLQKIDTSSGLQWNTPVALHPIDFEPSHLDSIHFDHSGSFALTADCRLRFFNGDDLLASVSSLDNDHLVFSTWFDKSVSVAREAVQSITFLSSNYTIAYEGPANANGWVIGSRNPESWVYRDGAFLSSFPGILGRDFQLTNSSTIEFDLSWTEPFQLLLNLYCDSAERMDYQNSYVLDIRADQVSMRHIGLGNGAPVRAFASAPLPIAPTDDKVRFTIQCNKAEGTISVLANGIPVKHWKDEHGFNATGGAVVFEQESVTGGVLKLSNMRISEWGGRYEPEVSSIATNTDAIRFINHDHALGKITGIGGGKVLLRFGTNDLQIPIQRVTQINFATNTVTPPAVTPWTVRARFLFGGSLSFQLESWNTNRVTGRSSTFGGLAFDPARIQQLEFNLNRSPSAQRSAAQREFDNLDE